MQVAERVETHHHHFVFDEVHGSMSIGVCTECQATTQGRNFLTRDEVDRLETKQGFVAEMPRRRVYSMTDAIKKALAPKPTPLPILLSADSLTMKSLNIMLPGMLIPDGARVTSIDITGDADLLSRIVIAFREGQMTVTVNLS